MNLSIIATNKFESFTYNLTFEVVNKVRVVSIDDFQIISNKEQLKEFEITFQSVGARTCLLLDFKDGVLKTYGNEEYCREWQPDVKYDESITEITSPQKIYHTY